MNYVMLKHTDEIGYMRHCNRGTRVFSRSNMCFTNEPNEFFSPVPRSIPGYECLNVSCIAPIFSHMLRYSFFKCMVYRPQRCLGVFRYAKSGGSSNCYQLYMYKQCQGAPIGSNGGGDYASASALLSEVRSIPPPMAVHDKLVVRRYVDDKCALNYKDGPCGRWVNSMGRRTDLMSRDFYPGLKLEPDCESVQVYCGLVVHICSAEGYPGLVSIRPRWKDACVTSDSFGTSAESLTKGFWHRWARQSNWVAHVFGHAAECREEALNLLDTKGFPRDQSERIFRSLDKRFGHLVMN